MKKNKIIFWVSTILSCLFFGPGAVTSAMGAEEWVKIITSLGYPAYFATYIGVLKILGVIALLIPGYYRIKEWAYAGFVFDLVSVIYSMQMSGQSNAAGWAFMLGGLAILLVSYFYYHKVYNSAEAGQTTV